VQTDGSLWCWGDNGWGQLGIGNNTQHNTPQQVTSQGDNWSTVSVAETDACAIKTDGTLWCWGDNGDGQLGLGTFYNQYKEPVQVGSDANWEQVSTSAYFTCAVKTTGTLWCWGYNYDYQLGIKDINSTAFPKQVGLDTDWAEVQAGSHYHTCARKTNGSIFCWGDNGDGQTGQEMFTYNYEPVKIPNP